MYKIIIKALDRKILSTANKDIKKALKSRKGHSLHEAENLLKSFKDTYKEVFKGTVILKEESDGLLYTFEHVEINPFSLTLTEVIIDQMMLVTDEIGGYEEVLRISEELREQYDEEEGKVDEVEDFSNLFDLIQTKSPQNVKNDSSHHMGIPPAAVEAAGENPIKEKNNPQVKENHVYPNHDIEKQEMQDNQPTEEIKKEPKKPMPQKESKGVAFPEFEDFLDLSNILEALKKKQEKFTQEHLLELFYFDQGKEPTELTCVIQDYVKSRLNGLELTALIDKFNSYVRKTTDITHSKLTEVYERTMAIDYKQQASHDIEEALESLRKKIAEDVLKYKGEIDKDITIKGEKLKAEHEEEMEALKREQLLRYNNYMKQLQEKGNLQIKSRESSLEADLEGKKEVILSECTDELKATAVESLVKSKIKATSEMSKRIEEAAIKTQNRIEEQIDKIKAEISRNTPQWQEEIDRKRKLEADKREEARKDKELSLLKSEYELRERMANADIESKEKELQIYKNSYAEISHLKELEEQRNIELKNFIYAAIEANNRRNELEKNNEQNRKLKLSKILTIAAIASLVVVLILIGMGFLF